MKMKLADFSLAWRWTEQNQSPLSESVLKQLIPYDREQAKQIEHQLSGYVKKTQLNRKIFHSCVSHPADKPCSSFLESLGISPESKIIMSWDVHTALSITWKIFKENWDAFCYPGSDDVFIFPEKQEWVLLYFHEEVFQFGRKRG